jgi:hypothetical protein
MGERMPDEPPPTGDGTPVWPLVIRDVIADMEERDRVGTERYGTPLRTFNGRRALVDAYQEALDGVVYLRQEMAEEGERAAARLRADAEGISLDQMDRVAESLLNADKNIWRIDGSPESVRDWQRLERYQATYVRNLRVRALHALTGLTEPDAEALLDRLLSMAEQGVDSRP